MNMVLTTMKELSGNKVDSGALEFGDSNTAKIVKTLKDAGIDLNLMGASTWQYDKVNDMLYWNGLDISGLSIGTEFPVMRYNGKTGTYTVWIAKVAEETTATGTHPYNIIGSMTGYEPSIKQTKDQQTYDNMLELYQDALRKYGF